MHPPPLSPQVLLRETTWLRALARSLVSDQHLAEDALQDTCVAALRHGPREPHRVRAWLAAVLRNFAFRAYRRRAAQAEIERLAARPEAQCSTAELTERVALHRSVVDAVLAMPEPCRSAVLLRFFEGLPPRAIARRLGVPVNTVRTRVQRGLAWLRGRLDAAHGGRAAWLGALVPLPGRAVLPGAAAGLVQGALLMSAAHKLALVAAVLGCGAVLFLVTRGAELTAPPPTVASDGTAASPAGPAATARAVGSRPDMIRVPAARTEEPAPGPRAVRITGRLVEEATGQPIAAAEVVLCHRWARRDGEPRARTDPTGAFVLDLPRRAPASGVRWPPADLGMEAADFAPWWGPVDLAALSAEPALSAHDLGTIQVPRGARVSGVVVAEATGASVPGATLLWTDLGTHNGLFLPRLSRAAGTSDAHGAFTLTERLPRTRGVALTLFAAAPTGLGWTAIEIPAERPILDTVRIVVRAAAAVRVQVTGPAGRPLPDAAVHALPVFAPLGPHKGWHTSERMRGQHGIADPACLAIFTGRTDAHGYAELTRLPPGPYDLHARHPDFHPGRQADVVLERDRTVTALLELRPAAPVTLTGRVVDSAAAPVPQARVRIEDPPTEELTDAAGRFRLGPARLSGRVRVTTQAEGFTQDVRVLDLAQTDATAELEIVLARLWPLAGRIVDQDGGPVAGVDLQARGQGSATEDLVFGGPTGRDGAFRLRVPFAGQIELTVQTLPEQDWAPAEPVFVQAGDEDVRVTLKRLPPGTTTLLVEAVTADDVPAELVDASLSPALSELEPRPPFATRLALAPGRATAPGLRPGTYTLALRDRHGARSTGAVVIPAAEREVRVRRQLLQAGAIQGRVVLDDLPAELRAGPLEVRVTPEEEGQQVDAAGRSLGRRGRATVDAAGDGSFRLVNVASGQPIRLELRHARLFAGATVVVPAGGEARVELRPALGARVHLATDVPVPRGTYVLTVQCGGPQPWLTQVERLDQPARIERRVAVPPGPFTWSLVGRVDALPGAPAREIRLAGDSSGAAAAETAVVIVVPR